MYNKQLDKITKQFYLYINFQKKILKKIAELEIIKKAFLIFQNISLRNL